jgi:hypothetical protein
MQAECAMYYWKAEEICTFEVLLQCFDLSQTISPTAILRLAVGRWAVELIGAGSDCLHQSAFQHTGRKKRPRSVCIYGSRSNARSEVGVITRMMLGC